MALVSPGVEVTITDQSQYLPAAQNSVPLVVLATAQNKANAAGDGVAQATTAANAGKLYLVTSQRDLVNLYGTPFFYTTTNGTPIQGYELNEYGLLAAYSVLGVTNRAYILRADIDLASLVGQTGRPVGTPANGSFWLNSSTSTWGIYEFSETTGKFTNKLPIVIDDSTNLQGDLPNQSLGNIGDYCVISLDNQDEDPVEGMKTYFYKDQNNVWVPLGSTDWKQSWPTIQGTASNPDLDPGDTIVFNWNGQFQFTITVPAGPNDTVSGVATQINNLGYGGLSAANVSGKLAIYMFTTEQSDYLQIASSTGTVLADLGLSVGTYYQPSIAWGTSAQMPLWTTGQPSPRPTGSVWLKVGSSGTGLNPVISEYSTALASWRAKTVSLYTSDWAACSGLDSTGGQTIPENTVYAQYNYDNLALSSNPETQTDPTPSIYYFYRASVGSTIVTGTDTSPTAGATGDLFVKISTPGSSALTPSGADAYTVSLTSGDDANDFVLAWQSANIPYTTAEVNSEGAVVITHTEGGVIIIDDHDYITGGSTGLLNDFGFIINTTPGVNYGPSTAFVFSGVQSTSSPGSGATFNIVKSYGNYILGTSYPSGGSGYSVGDIVTIDGADVGGVSGTNDITIKVVSVSTGAITAAVFVSGTATVSYWHQFTNWYPLTYTPSTTAPNVAPANNTNWFYSVNDEVDIMINYNGEWKGYRTLTYDSSGFPAAGTNFTDPNGPICQASEPTVQSDGTPLVYGDLWIDTNELENYPVMYRWENANATDQWVLIDTTDQVSSTGIVFADARWAPNGTTNPYNDPVPTIKSLLTSNYLDLDAPSPALYPSGMLLWNTRRSGYNVKQFRLNYFNSVTFPDESLPTETDAWVTVSGNQSNGAMFAGRKAQRNMVVQSLRSVIDTNTAIRDEDNAFNLIATPNYPELQPNMVVLNNDRGETGYIVGDTPMRLEEQSTAIQAWATNAAGATSTGENGLVTRNTYMGLFYPSGLASDLSGNEVAVPSSHMMLRTIIRNDQLAYPWFAPAGTRRGIIDNALSIGYLDSTTGEFITTKTRLGIRDTLYVNFINPMVFFTGQGLLNYGNKTSFDSQSALDRINVARLIAYTRRQLTLAARPFVFEPNDAVTRAQIQGVVQTLMVDLVAKRGIYDYLVVCDESNNTPARIDRNELWIDVALEPVKAAEFIYIPVRILNTGELASL
jgi:hypothetical protein